MRYLGEGTRAREDRHHRLSVDANRLRDLSLELVEVESPTGDTAEVARLYGRRLEDRPGGRAPGRRLPGDADRAWRGSTAIGPARRSSSRPSRHGPDPARPASNRRRPDLRSRLRRHEGRGPFARRGGAACSAEGPFPGELVLVAIGIHEAPSGRGEDLTLSPRRAWASRPTSGSSASSAVRRSPSRTRAGDGRDHDPPRRRRHLRAADRGRHAAPAPRRRQGDRGDGGGARRAGRGRTPVVRAETTSSARRMAATSITAGPPSCRLVGTRRWTPGNTLAAVDAELSAARADR